MDKHMEFINRIRFGNLFLSLFKFSKKLPLHYFHFISTHIYFALNSLTITLFAGSPMRSSCSTTPSSCVVCPMRPPRPRTKRMSCSLTRSMCSTRNSSNSPLDAEVALRPNGDSEDGQVCKLGVLSNGPCFL